MADITPDDYAFINNVRRRKDQVRDDRNPCALRRAPAADDRLRPGDNPDRVRLVEPSAFQDTSSLGDQLTVIRFETFEMDINSRRLLDGGKPVRIGARAFDLLRYLALNAGRILSKAELLEAVWPKATVDEIAIRVHLVELRKILRTKPDDPWIRAVPGRGYLFLKPVEMGRLAKPGPVDAGLPYVPAEILGRSTFIESSIEVLEVHRLQSVIGTGGIGKTSVAVEIGNHFRAIGRRVIFLDLSTLTADSQLVSYLAIRLD